MTSLKNLRVLELSEGVSGALAALRLGELGADVIKIEPLGGDWIREAAPALPGSQTSAVFFELNRGKRSVQLGSNLAGAAVVIGGLAKQADVLILDYPKADIEALGLGDPATLNPELIVIDISPWGQNGPMAELAGSELTAQAMAGYTRYLGQLNLPPRRLGADVGSVATGIYAAQAALAALYYRNNGGGGQQVAVSMLNSLLSMKSIHLAAQSDPDAYLGPRIGGPYHPVEQGWSTKDRPIFFAFGGSVGSTGRAGWETFIEELGMTEMLDDKRFDKNGKNSTGHGSQAIELRPEYEKHFKNWPSKDLVAKMHKYRANASVYATTEEALEHAQSKALGIVTEVPHGDRTVKVRAFPGKFSDMPLKARGNAPELGRDLDSVMAELGIGPDQLSALEAEGAFART